MVLRRKKSFVPKYAGSLTYLKGCFSIWAAPTSPQVSEIETFEDLREN
jgi:hypothetical protein